MLLYGTSYVSDQGGPGTAEWSTAQACLILGGLAAILIAAWGLLEWLSVRAGGVTPALCLAIASAGAGLAVMISGYMSGGQKGLVLSGALAGAAVAALLMRWRRTRHAPLGSRAGRALLRDHDRPFFWRAIDTARRHLVLQSAAGLDPGSAAGAAGLAGRHARSCA